MKPTDKTVVAGVGARLSGVIQASVIDAATGKVVRAYPRQNNLILNQGLNLWCNRTYYGFPNGFLYAVAGTGTTPVKVDSGTATASQSGTTVTFSTSVLTSTAIDSGRSIKWDSGEEAMIVTVTDGTTAVVNVSQTVASGEYTIYNTNQTSMGGGIDATPSVTESKRTNTYVTGSGDCGATWTSPHIVEQKRTYDFSAESGSVTYTEIGMSRLVTANSASLFMRVLLDTPISLTAGQQLRLVYILTVTYSPSSTTSYTFPITGWPVSPATTVDGNAGWEYLDPEQVQSTGSSGGSNCDPNGIEHIITSTRTTALPSVPSHVEVIYNTLNLELKAPVWETYVTNSFVAVMSATFDPSESNSTAIRSIWISYSDLSGNNLCYYRILFNEAQTKDSLHRLVLRFQWSVSRVLA